MNKSDDFINANILILVLSCSFQIVIKGNWAKGAKDLSISFLTTAYVSTIILK